MSNSSSESFVCDICHTGHDVEVSFVESVYFLKCVNGHYFCREHVEQFKDMCKEITQLYWYEEEVEGGGKHLEESIIFNVPTEYCPICQGKFVTDDMLIRYLEQLTGLDKNTIKQNIMDARQQGSLL